MEEKTLITAGLSFTYFPPRLHAPILRTGQPEASYEALPCGNDILPSGARTPKSPEA